MSCRSLVWLLLGLGLFLELVVPAAAATVYTFTPELFVRETYDDNVGRVHENPRDEFITTVGAGFGLTAVAPQFDASAHYRFGIEFFAKETEDQGRTTHTGAISLTRQVTPRLTVNLGDGLRYSRRTEPDAALAIPAPPAPPGPGPAPIPAPLPAEPGTLPTRSVRQLRNTARVALAYQYSLPAVLDGAYSYSVTEFDAPDLIDTQTHRLSAGVTRQLSERNAVGVEYSVSLFRFDDPERERREVHALVGKWRHTLSPETVSEVTAGVAWTDEGDVTGRGEARLTSRMGLTRYMLEYTGSVSVNESTGELNRVDRVAVGLARELSARVTAALGGAVARSEPLDGTSKPIVFYSAAAELEAILTRWLRAGVAYSFERREAVVAEDSFTNNRVTVGLSVVFPTIANRSL